MSDTLAIEVSDFGPIISAKVDLRPLTVFVGPSNTGKSYLAILLYALHRHFGIRHGARQLYSPFGHVIRRFNPSHMNINLGEISEQKIINSLSDMAETMLDNIEKTGGRKFNYDRFTENGPEINAPLPPLIAEIIRRNLYQHEKILCQQVLRCFGMKNISELIRTEKGDCACIRLYQKIEDKSLDLRHEIVFSKNKFSFIPSIPDYIEIPVYENILDEIESLEFMGEKWEYLFQGIMSNLYNRVLQKISSHLSSNAHYLPAGRASIMQSNNMFIRALIENAATAGIRPMSAGNPQLSGVLADFLEELIQINDSSQYDQPSPNTTIEKSIINGMVGIERSEMTGYPNFTYLPSNWKAKNRLSLMHASSMVSELAPIVFYLRYVVKKGDVLMIEEPESHLHPAKQVELTRQIALLVRSGIRVIITTHSEWLLEELSNVVQRSGIPEKQRANDSSDIAALHPDEVGVWLFEPSQRPRGSKVREVGIDESGLYQSDFEKVAMALHNDWANISSRKG